MAVTSPVCPVCGGPIHDVRAKLVCRQCGMILETCCEGGPMGSPCEASPGPGDTPAAPSSRPESSDDFQSG